VTKKHGFPKKMVYKGWMQLGLIRHGECELTAASDAARRLTAEGRADVEKVARHAHAAKWPTPDIVLCSPLQRAWQTAEIFNAYWGREIQVSDWLQPHVEASKILEVLKKAPNTNFALVGHMPNLGLLLAILLWGLPPREALIPRGAAARLELPAWEPGKAALKQFLKPEELP